MLITSFFTTSAIAQSVTYTYSGFGKINLPPIPTCVSQIRVQAWGGGGGGGYRGIAGESGTPGGGGGAYAEVTFKVEPGQIYSYVIGAGGIGGEAKYYPNFNPLKNGQDTYFYSPVGEELLRVNGGKGAYDNTTTQWTADGGFYGNGGAATLGFISYKGGDGGAALGGETISGGGGGAAKVDGPGGNAQNSKGVTPIKPGGGAGVSAYLGGDGGKGVKNTDPVSDDKNGKELGGGGAGTWKKSNATKNGGKGGNGGIIIIYIGGENKFANNTEGFWTTSGNWSTGSLPDQSKCVIIPTGSYVKVNLNTAVAKTLTVENGGKLSIFTGRSLTVQNEVVNKSLPENFVVESDANLIQVSDVSNSGKITVQRFMKPREVDNVYSAKEYSYYSSPVASQNMKAIFGGSTANTDFALKLDEPKNSFVNASLSDYNMPGKGFAIKDPTVKYVENLGSPVSVLTTFKGVPNNGTIEVPITKTGS